MALRARARHSSKRVCSQHYIDYLSMKRKVKALLAQEGPKAQELFWELTKFWSHKSSGIKTRESGGVLFIDPHSMALLVEAVFETKFNTS